MKNFFRSAFIPIVFFSSSCAYLQPKDPRHTQAENLYAQVLNKDDYKELSEFIDDQVKDLKDQLVEGFNKTGQSYKVEVKIKQIMLLDGDKVGVVALDVSLNKEPFAEITLFIIKNLNWSIETITYKTYEPTLLK